MVLSSLGKAPTLSFCSTVYTTGDGEAIRSTWIGINSGSVAQRVSDWLRGVYRVLFANRMLTEGFDCPRLDRVWLDKSTDSLLLLVQCAGRALRALPGKRAAIYCGQPETAELLRAALQRCDGPR